MTDNNAILLCHILNEAWPGQFVTQHLGIPGSRYSFDVAHIGNKIAIEIEGGMYHFWVKRKDGTRFLANKGGHTSAAGVQRDMEKNNAAVLEGWKMLRYTPETLNKNTWKIIKDLWLLIGKPTGKHSIAMLEASLKQEEKKHARKKVSMIEGQQRIA